MKEEFPIHAAQFFTATIYDWQHVLADNTHKDIIIESMQYLVNDKRIELNAFIIMSNHIHLVWQSISWLYTFTNSGFFYEVYSAADKAFAHKK